MSSATHVDQIPNLRRIENFAKEQMVAYAMELTHAVYPHDEVYRQCCTVEECIDCPPEDVFAHLASAHTLAEWTFSLRDFGEPDADGDGAFLTRA